jgi:hypothetical protein
MNILQINFVVRSGVSAFVVAFVLGYSARYQWGLSQSTIRTDALLAALLIGTLVAIEFLAKACGSQSDGDRPPAAFSFGSCPLLSKASYWNVFFWRGGVLCSSG